MTKRDDSARAINQLIRASSDRRAFLRRAAGLGLSATALSTLARGPLPARAQGTPAAVAAPGGNEPKGPQVEKLVFWTRANPDDPGEPNVYTQLEAIGQAYRDAIGTEIEFVNVPDADFRNRMSIAAPGGEGPDVFGPIAHDWLGEFAIQQIALPIPDGAVPTPEDFLPVSFDLTRVDGTLYAIPVFVESVALIYNKDMVSEPPATWDELVATASELTNAEAETYGFGFPLLEQYHEGGFFHGFGSYIFAYENGVFNTEDIGINNAGGVEAAKFLRDMYHQAQPPMPEAAIDRANMHGFQEGLMESGQLAMTINGPWRELNLRAAGINFGVATLPTLPNGEPMRPFVGVQAMVASAYGENQEAALDFIAFATGTNSAVQLFQAEPKPPARISAQQSETVQANPNTAVWAEQATLGIAMPNIAAMGSVWTPWGAAMDAIVAANAPDDQIQGLLDDAVAQIREAIAAN